MKQIEFIQNGTVIDHIDSGRTLRILSTLGLLDDQDNKIMIGHNFESGRIGKKDIIKISNKFLTKSEMNKISVLCPNATVSIIKEGSIHDKFNLSVEDEIVNIIKCSNKVCMTNNEDMKTRFIKSGEEFKCNYCEKSVTRDKLLFK